MPQCLLIIISLFYSLNIYGQKLRDKKNPAPPAPIENDCIKRYDYPLSQRLKNYPFNTFSKIVIVSFNTQFDSLSQQKQWKLPHENENLILNEITEIITLNNNQIDSLTNILYNYDYKNNVGTIVYNCFNPRHAIVFLDEQDKILNYLEICFECKGYYKSDEKIKVGNFCEGKYNLLKLFFEQVGIKKGLVVR